MSEQGRNAPDRGAAPAAGAPAPGARARRRAALPDATVARLPVYLRVLRALADSGSTTVSSTALAARAGVGPALLRKDLSHLGSYGTRGVGYDVDELVRHVSRTLGLTQRWPVVLVGVGNLGRALAGFGGFSSRGFGIAALLDDDPARVGEQVDGRRVRHLDELEEVVSTDDVSIGVIATPADVAQAVCDRLVRAGITSVLSFAPVGLHVPEGVELREVDLSLELQILSFHRQRRTADLDLSRRLADGVPA